MRFISRSPGFKCFPIHGTTNILTNLPEKQGVIAAFTQNIPIEEWEYAAALAHFRFPGSNLEDDGGEGGMPVSPTGRISVYDTDIQAKTFAWPEKQKAEVEAAMLTIAANSHEQDFFRVEKPAVERPWPSYDDFTEAAKIVAFVEQSGIPTSGVIAYERENKNRAAVIKALEAIESPTIVPA